MSQTQPNFGFKLTENIHSCGNALCLGIDPDLENAPVFMGEWVKSFGASSYMEHFCRALIQAGKGHVPAVKFQSAFFEAFGNVGIAIMEKMIGLARSEGYLTILDAKRGDISSTMRAYGQMAFETMKADVMTVTPYMGTDTLVPLIPWLRKGHGVYLVWVTSNPSGQLIQDCVLESSLHKVSTHIFHSFDRFFETEALEDSYGWVVGATRISAIDSQIRSILPQERLLIPGIGAQGGEVTPDLMAILTSGNSLVSQSRGISRGPDSLKNWEDFYNFVKEKLSAAANEVKISY